MSRPMVTVIIPTRERADTLWFSLRSVCQDTDPGLEIIVSDNASTDDTRAVVEGVGDSRVRYVNTGRRVSMSANWEFALSHATGEWVGYIGDDDAIVPGAVSQLRAAGDADAVRGASAQYHWTTGRLCVPAGQRTAMVDGAAQLARVMAGRAEYSTLPMLYHGGFARRDLIESARGADGLFFGSQSPDVYSGIALAAKCRHFLRLRRPLAINGASQHSTGAAFFARSGKAYARFASEPNLPLHPAIAPIDGERLPRSIQACVLESYLQASERIGGLCGLDISAQLRLILTDARDPQEAREWATRFAGMHSVNTPATAHLRGLRAIQTQLRRAFPDHHCETSADLGSAAQAVSGMAHHDRLAAVRRNVARKAAGLAHQLTRTLTVEPVR